MTEVLQSERPAAPVTGAAGSSGQTATQTARLRRHTGLLFVAPWLLGLVLFYAGPMLATLAMSFTDYSYAGDQPARFIGLENWSRVVRDPDVATSVVVTLKFALLFVPVMTLVPLALAYLLTSRDLWARGLFRAVFFLPAVVPAVSGLFVWRGFLNAEDGWFNRMLGVLGIPGPDWISDAQWVLPSYGLIAAWGVGNAILIFIGALNGVPRDLFEAAKLDGAGAWRTFRHVTLPMISPITFYNLVLTLVALGQYFIVPFVMTSGTAEPDNAALIYTMNFYRESFVFYDAGYGSALAWLMFAVIMALTALLFWSQRFWVHYEYEAGR